MSSNNYKNNIKCPFCFKHFKHDEVHFRSKIVYKASSSDSDNNMSDFISGNSKSTNSNAESKSFFTEADDDKYTQFWRESKSTEENYFDKHIAHIKPYKRRVIEPSNGEHQKYLIEQNTEYDDYRKFLHYDAQGMVDFIEITDNGSPAVKEKSNLRVCPHCHNPLPINYGKYDTRYISVVGITSAGKTVYLRQLIDNLSTYTPNVGLGCEPANGSAENFLKSNNVKVGEPLPVGTPPRELQQPLFFDVVRTTESGKTRFTIVLYDVAGEVCLDRDMMDKFGPFIANSDGIILLIDPSQIEVVKNITSLNGNSNDIEDSAAPKLVLDRLRDYLHSNDDEDVDVPIAVCVSKSDQQNFEQSINEDVYGLFNRQIEPIVDGNGDPMPIFNAKEHNKINIELRDYFKRSKDIDLIQILVDHYCNYGFFAISALGCDVENISEDNTISAPVGPILPTRIEEPLYWLFYHFNFIGTNTNPINFSYGHCDKCNNDFVVKKIPEVEYTVGRLWNKQIVKENRECINCRAKWYHESEQHNE